MNDQERTRELLDRLMPHPGPTAGFARRVLARSEGPRRPHRLLGIAVVTAAMAAAVWLVSPVLRRRPPELSNGHGLVRAAARETLRIADRAVAVIEPTGEVAWRASDGLVEIEQRRGDVFYRVDWGGPFVVATPAGRVMVTGTCFRVVLSGAETALVTSVQVLEGSVTLQNHGGQAHLVAGDWGRLAPAQPPERLPTMTAATLPLGPDLTGRIAALALAQTDESPGEPAGVPAKKVFGFSPEERRVLARRCKFRWGLPKHIVRWAAFDAQETADLSAEQVTALNRVLEEHRAEYFDTLRAIHIEVTGDPEVDKTLSAMALHHEINAKSSNAEGVAARQRILQEWAGDLPPPAEGAAQRPVERLWRLQVGVLDDLERRLAPIVGPARARTLTQTGLELSVYGDEKACPSGSRQD